MKVMIIMNDDGHFSAADCNDRQAIVELFDELEGGWDYIEDIVEELDDHEKELWNQRANISQDVYVDLLRNFEQRGMLEIIEL